MYAHNAMVANSTKGVQIAVNADFDTFRDVGGGDVLYQSLTHQINELRQDAAIDWGYLSESAYEYGYENPETVGAAQHNAVLAASFFPVGGIFTAGGLKGAQLVQVLNAEVKTFAELRLLKLKDAHHVIQNAAVKDIANYSRNKAPSVHLPGPSFNANTPHGIATKVQASYPKVKRGTYGAEREVAFIALRRAGYTKEEAYSILKKADEYFMGQLGLTKSSQTRIPGK